MAKPSNSTLAVSIVTALAVGYVLGFFVQKISDDNHMENSNASHHEKPVWNVADVEAPSVEINLEKDALGGWNLFLETEKFAFSPESAGDTHVDGEGHAHLYVDGEKVTRLYGPAYYFSEFEEGTHEIRVTLNNNTHSQYAVNGELIEDVLMFTVDDDHAHIGK